MAYHDGFYPCLVILYKGRGRQTCPRSSKTVGTDQHRQNLIKKALEDTQTISANNEAISIAQTAVASAEEALKRTETILAQTKTAVEQVAVTEARAYITPTADAVVKNNKAHL